MLANCPQKAGAKQNLEHHVTENLSCPFAASVRARRQHLEGAAADLVTVSSRRRCPSGSPMLGGFPLLVLGEERGNLRSESFHHRLEGRESGDEQA